MYCSIRYSRITGVAHCTVKQPGTDYIIHAMCLVVEPRKSSYLYDCQTDISVHCAITLYERSILADCTCSLEKRYPRT